MYRMAWLSAAAIAVVGSLLAAGCGGGGPGQDLQFGLVSLRVVLPSSAAQVIPRNAADQIADVTVEVSGPEMDPTTYSLEWDPGAGEATGTIEVPQGIDRVFDVTALDADGVELFAGRTTADVEAGATTSVTVHLWPVSAQVTVDVGIENPYPGLGRLDGLCYGPFRAGQSPNQGVFPSQEEVEEDMQILADRVQRLRLFSSTHIHRNIPRLAGEAGLACYAQAWLDNVEETNREEIDALIAIGQAGEAEALIVGSEVLLRGELSADQLIGYIGEVRAAVPELPVTYNDTFQVLLDNPNVVAACDLVLANFYPFWEGVHIDRAIGYLSSQYERITAAYPGKQVVIGETGWPSGGGDHALAVSDPVNQRRFLTEFVTWARSREVEYFFFEAFDEPWKASVEGSVGAHWGIWDADRAPKAEILRVFF